jgi:glycosyltransferase involved in cell wall biosynthesis
MTRRRGLRIGLNLFFLGPEAGGAGRYARELVANLLRLEPELKVTVFVSKDASAEFLDSLPWRREVTWIRLRSAIGGPPGHVLVEMAAQMGAVAVHAARRRLDLVHGLANVGPVTGRSFARVVTLLDITWMHQPETLDWRTRWGMKASSLASARAADRVIAISDTTRQDFLATLGLEREKVDSVPLGVAGARSPTLAPEEVRTRFDLGAGSLVLSVAALRPHKNLPVLVDAFSRLQDSDAHLVIAGSGGTPDEERRVRQTASHCGVGERVRVLGAVSEEELEGLYGAADCFVLASLHEGFGLPILEAMARGVPVACSDRSALAEVAGDAAAQFDPSAPGSIATAVRRVLTDPGLARRLVERGRERAEVYTWERTALGTLDTYRRAVAQRHRHD